jgi:hypothetical protein
MTLVALYWTCCFSRTQPRTRLVHRLYTQEDTFTHGAHIFKVNTLYWTCCFSCSHELGLSMDTEASLAPSLSSSSGMCVCVCVCVCVCERERERERERESIICIHTHTHTHIICLFASLIPSLTSRSIIKKKNHSFIYPLCPQLVFQLCPKQK